MMEHNVVVWVKAADNMLQWNRTLTATNETMYCPKEINNTYQYIVILRMFTIFNSSIKYVVIAMVKTEDGLVYQ